MPHIITCLTGLTGSLRGLKVREERFLADRKLAKTGSVVDALLRACWEETHDAGPYDSGGKTIDWDKVLQGDRFFALIEIRALTYGSEYAFSVTCSEAGCRARIDWELDLRQLPVRPLSDASRAAFLDGNRFETKPPDVGRRAWFRLLTGADERKLPAIRRNAGERMLSAMLGFRCLEVEGIEDKDERRFLEEITMRDADFFLDEFDRVDCGVETTLEVECPECFARQHVQLSFDQSFFLPGKPGRRGGGPRTTPPLRRPRRLAGSRCSSCAGVSTAARASA